MIAMFMNCLCFDVTNAYMCICVLYMQHRFPMYQPSKGKHLRRLSKSCSDMSDMNGLCTCTGGHSTVNMEDRNKSHGIMLKYVKWLY